MRSRTVMLWVGASALVIALMVAAFLAGTVLGNPVLANVDEVVVAHEGLNLTIGARIVIVPRVRATFDGVDGELHLGEQRVDYKVEGITPGDQIEPNVAHRVTVAVTLTAADLGAVLLRSAQSGKLTFDFDGTVHASVLGVPLTVPVTFERTVSY